MKKTKKAMALLLSMTMLFSSAAATAVPAFAAEADGGAAATRPIKIEAEDFTSQQGVQKTDVAGNPGVGYIHTGDYMEYSGIEIPGDGTYLFTYVYTAWPSTAPPVGSAPTFRVEIDGEDVTGTIAPALADIRTLQSALVEIPLTKGTHTMRIIPTATGNLNFDWFSFTEKRELENPDVWIEGEDYSNMYGIGTENCLDVGGGRNVAAMHCAGFRTRKR